MPFIPHTPESLIQRSDSKNPGTTCKGITSAGRPCRRDIRSSPQSSPTGNRKSKGGVIAVLQPQDEDHEGAAAYFCFQHKDQAETLAGGNQDGRQTNIVPVQQRTSIDTLVDRTGVLDIEEDEIPSKGRHKRAHARPARKETLPRKWQDVEGPLIAISGEKQTPAGRGTQRRQAKGQTNISFSLFCCTNSDRDALPPPRVQRHSEKSEHPCASVKMPSSMQQGERPGHSRPSNSRLPVGQPSGSPRPSQVMQESNSTKLPSRPSAQQHRSSHTQDLLTLMPTTLSPQTTSLLLAELAKPVSPHDEEGYIYMFWLTDDTIAAPDVQAASSLLSHGASGTTNGGRKSNVLAQSPNNKSASSKSKTMLLKIGRASNVQRRMNEWNRQCGYKLSLIRFYPYLSTSPLPSRPNTSSPPASPSAPQKVPHAHRVERLIHLELAEQRVKRDCESCGKEHREWFEVESSRNGLRGVDEVIRRWTEWGMRAGG